MNNPNEGDLRVWNTYLEVIPNKGLRFVAHYPVKSPEHGKKLIEALADSQLLNHSVSGNAFGLEVFEDGEWVEWYSDLGDDVNEANFEGVTQDAK